MTAHPAPRAPLFALATALGSYLVAEVFAAGALMSMSRDLHVDPGQVGSLVSTYAVVALFTVLPVTAWTDRWPPGRALAIAMTVLAVTHVAIAWAPTLSWVAAGRAVAALFHGTVWAAGPVVAARLVPERPATATGTVFAGSSVAIVAGAPLVAAVSDTWSWRVASVGVGVLAGLCALALARTLRSLPPTPRPPSRGSVGPGLGSVVLWCSLVVLVAAAHFAAFTYVTDDAARVGIGGPWIPVLLAAMGVAGLLGTLLAGPAHDRHPQATVVAALVATAIGLAGTGVGPVGFVVGALVWPLAYSALVVCLPARVVAAAPSWSARASAWYVLAFQIGIAAGAWLGGTDLLPIDAARVTIPSALVAVAALVALARGRRTARG